MKIKILCFANIKDIIGRDAISMDVDQDISVEGLFTRLQEEYPKLTGYGNSLSFIVNEEFCDRTTVLKDSDEVVFVPPVSGGSSKPFPEMFSEDNFLISREPLDAGPVINKVIEKDGYTGAIIVFYGITRTHSRGRIVNYLEYDGYEKVAKKQLHRIGLDAKAKFDLLGMAITHRLGEVPSGEASVVIAVASAHRVAAYDASRYAIEEIKKIVPIWKKEIFDDGEVWIEGGQPTQV